MSIRMKSKGSKMDTIMMENRMRRFQWESIECDFNPSMGGNACGIDTAQWMTKTTCRQENYVNAYVKTCESHRQP